MTATEVRAAAAGDSSPTSPLDLFAPCRERLEMLVSFLEAAEAAAASHAELEHRVSLDGREVLRLAFQGHLDLRSSSEQRVEVTDAAGLSRGSTEAGHERALATVFGEVTLSRLAYRRRSCPNLHPADGALNLPNERYSHGLRELAATEAARGSFDGAVEAIEAATGQHLGKRQVEELAARAAVDFEAFYAHASRPQAGPTDVVVLSADGKGIVMRPGSLRPATAKAAAAAVPKLATRLSKGEKANRKRMATVGAVYDLTPVPRSPADILARGGGTGTPPTPAPVTKDKWLMASVEAGAAAVVARVFDEAQRRDPGHRRPWVALVDGNNHQIDRIKAEAKARKVTVPIVVDFIHVLEYLWGAAWCFFAEGDAKAQAWVADKAMAVLNGHASTVAASIRRKATCCRLDGAKRAKADTCADYLLAKRPYLDYPTALAQGWPIATGVIEGACRHLVKDRMDITGARWSVAGAEAVLKLRALRANHEFPAYWQFHLSRELQRVHQACYADNVIPTAA